MRMTDGDLWYKCASCVKVYSDDPPPAYEEILSGLEDWFFTTRGKTLPVEWGDPIKGKEAEARTLCHRMKLSVLSLAMDAVYYGEWNESLQEHNALELMEALERYFGKEYC